MRVWYDGPSSFHAGVVDAEKGRRARTERKALETDIEAATQKLERDLELAKQSDEDRVREIRRQGEADKRTQGTYESDQRLRALREKSDTLGLERETADQKLQEEAARAFEANGGSRDDAIPFMGPPSPSALTGEDNHVLATVTRMSDKERAKQLLGIQQLKKQIGGQQRAAQAALDYIGSLAKGQKDAEGEDIAPLLGEEEFTQITEAIGAWQQSGGTAGLDPSTIVPQLIEAEQAERKKHQYRKTGMKAAVAMRARIDAEIANPDSLIDPDNLVEAGILLDGWVSHDGRMFDEPGDPGRMMQEVRQLLQYGRRGSTQGRDTSGADKAKLRSDAIELLKSQRDEFGNTKSFSAADVTRTMNELSGEAPQAGGPAMPTSTQKPGTIGALRESNPTAYMDTIGKLAQLKAQGASREEFEAFAKQTGTDLNNLAPEDRAAIEEAMKGLQRTGQNATLDKNKSAMRKMLDGGPKPVARPKDEFTDADAKRLAELEAKKKLRADEQEELDNLRELQAKKKPTGTAIKRGEADAVIQQMNEAARGGK